MDTDSTPAATTAQPVQAPLSEQVRAVAEVLLASPALLTQAYFKNRGPWKRSLPTLLRTLAALGGVQTTTIGGIMGWR